MCLHVFSLNSYSCVVSFEPLGEVDVLGCILFKYINMSSTHAPIRNFKEPFTTLFNTGLTR